MAHLQRQDKWSLGKLRFPKHDDIDRIAIKIRHLAKKLRSIKKNKPCGRDN